MKVSLERKEHFSNFLCHIHKFLVLFFMIYEGWWLGSSLFIKKEMGYVSRFIYSFKEEQKCLIGLDSLLSRSASSNSYFSLTKVT